MDVLVKIKIIFICLRHGINPFSTIQDEAGKMKARFSENEKQWFIDNANKWNREFFIKLFESNS